MEEVDWNDDSNDGSNENKKIEHKFDIKELEYKPVARKQDSTIIKICKKNFLSKSNMKENHKI